MDPGQLNMDHMLVDNEDGQVDMDHGYADIYLLYDNMDIRHADMGHRRWKTEPWVWCLERQIYIVYWQLWAYNGVYGSETCKYGPHIDR